MEVERQDTGHWSFHLGPVERWVVGVVAAATVAAMYWFAASITSRLDKLADGQANVVTQQAVTNSQMATLNLQLADVPALSRQMAELKVRVDRHDEDIRELRGTRGLK